MSNTKIISESPISMVELKTQLTKIKKRDGELSFRANKCEDYLNTFVDDSQKAHKDFKEALEGLNIPRLKEQHIIKLLDIKPKTHEQVKVVIQGYNITITQDNLKKIAKVFN
jgi:DNA-directed RNA polymerase subunit F